MNELVSQIAAIVVAVLAFATAFWLYRWVSSQDSSNKRIAEVGQLIKDGANTFLRKEYTALSVFCGVVALLILLFLPSPIWIGSAKKNIIMTLAYIFGTVFSAIAGKIGIDIATIANIKSAEAATKGIEKSFMSGFRGGAVMGMAVVGSSLLGVALVMWLTGDTTALLGFSFGASSLALFAKAGGGIFTKTADISADLVGKVELGLPEDDPRNPAVIADNVGDNVGDVAGMGADLFDSHVASMAAALVMAAAIGGANVTMVFVYATIGLLASIIGVAGAKMKPDGDPTRALNSSTYVTTAIFAVLTALATWVFDFEWRIYLASVFGLLIGVVIGITTDYYTNDEKKPVRDVAQASTSGPAFTILSGISN
ncbi:MAG TPA: sodium-translocating pyrophosphatase, partial [Clostridiales bacterium]|nr:sodium-translocating pyrophosphatase [Clostridiales bacterium]